MNNTLRLKRSNKIKTRRPSDIVLQIILVVLMALFSFSYIFMFVWMLMSSFRTSSSFNSSPINIFDFSGQSAATLFNNYKQAFSFEWTTMRNRQLISVNMFGMFKNSIILVVLNILMGIAFPPLVGYVVAKFDFKLKKVINFIVVVMMCVPTVGSLIPTVKFLNAVGLRDTWTSIILLGSGGLGMGVLLYGGYFSSIPSDYIESATLDGASNMQVYLKVMFPQALPLLVSMGIMSFIGSWNDYTTPFIYLRYNPTIATGVEYISARSQIDLNPPMLFAALFVMSSFTLIIYACFSKTIMSSMSVGGVKG